MSASKTKGGLEMRLTPIRLTGVAVTAIAFALLLSAELGHGPFAAVDPRLSQEASLRIDGLATGNPCLTNNLTVGVQDYLSDDQVDQLFFDVTTLDVCTTPNRVVYEAFAQGARDQISEAAFTVTPGNDIGALAATVPALESATSTVTPITFDLRWLSGTGVNQGPIRVVGTVSVGGQTMVLDDSIVWNNWGSEAGFPWAGMWLCHWADGESSGGCATQPPPTARPH